MGAVAVDARIKGFEPAKKEIPDAERDCNNKASVAFGH
jgi:hypothetical protein